MSDDAVTESDTAVHSGGSALLSSTRKTLAVLEVMAAEGRALGVSELARLLDSSRGTVHKRLATLAASGWVEQSADGRYRLSLLAARVGNAALEQVGLGDRIQHVLEGIAAVTGETASIAALFRDSGLIVQRAESEHVLHADIRVGTRIPLTEGASNLVLLAFALNGEQREILRSRGVQLASEARIARVHKAGVATTVDEFVGGITAVSIPFRDELRFKTLALTVAGPNGRLDVGSAERALHAARERIASLAALGARSELRSLSDPGR